MSTLLAEREKQHILEDFPNLINEWCQVTSEIEKIPEEEMCAYAVKIFGNKVSPSKIRYLILPKFKNKAMAELVSKRPVKELSTEKKVSRVRQLMRDLKLEGEVVVRGLANPMHETAVFLNKPENKTKMTQPTKSNKPGVNC